MFSNNNSAASSRRSTLGGGGGQASQQSGTTPKSILKPAAAAAVVDKENSGTPQPEPPVAVAAAPAAATQKRRVSFMHTAKVRAVPRRKSSILGMMPSGMMPQLGDGGDTDDSASISFALSSEGAASAPRRRQSVAFASGTGDEDMQMDTSGETSFEQRSFEVPVKESEHDPQQQQPPALAIEEAEHVFELTGPADDDDDEEESPLTSPTSSEMASMRQQFTQMSELSESTITTGMPVADIKRRQSVFQAGEASMELEETPKAPRRQSVAPPAEGGEETMDFSEAERSLMEETTPVPVAMKRQSNILPMADAVTSPLSTPASRRRQSVTAAMSPLHRRVLGVKSPKSRRSSLRQSLVPMPVQEPVSETTQSPVQQPPPPPPALAQVKVEEQPLVAAPVAPEPPAPLAINEFLREFPAPSISTDLPLSIDHQQETERMYYQLMIDEMQKVIDRDEAYVEQEMERVRGMDAAGLEQVVEIIQQQAAIEAETQFLQWSCEVVDALVPSVQQRADEVERVDQQLTQLLAKVDQWAKQCDEEMASVRQEWTRVGERRAMFPAKWEDYDKVINELEQVKSVNEQVQVKLTEQDQEIARITEQVQEQVNRLAVLQEERRKLSETLVATENDASESTEWLARARHSYDLQTQVFLWQVEKLSEDRVEMIYRGEVRVCWQKSGCEWSIDVHGGPKLWRRVAGMLPKWFPFPTKRQFLLGINEVVQRYVAMSMEVEQIANKYPVMMSNAADDSAVELVVMDLKDRRRKSCLVGKDTKEVKLVLIK